MLIAPYQTQTVCGCGVCVYVFGPGVGGAGGVAGVGGVGGAGFIPGAGEM